MTNHTKTSPFYYKNDDLYQQWKQQKFTDYPTSIKQLIVPIKDPSTLTPTEIQQLHHHLLKTNMVIYDLQGDIREDKSIPQKLCEQLGIYSLDKNECADQDGFTSIQVATKGLHTLYIPYSDKPINWHTDGYYNKLSEQIYSMVLHCVRPAQSGGDNQLWDPEVIFSLLHDTNPLYIKALMADNAMTIPKNVIDGKLIRPDRTGPVFMVTAQGRLHMRYSARARNVIWHDDELTQAAQLHLRERLNSTSDYCFQGKLLAGQGLICNNVLHTRSAFKNDPQAPRLLYRGRYFDQLL